MKISGIFVCLNTDIVANIRYLPFRKGYFFSLIIAQNTPMYRQNHVNRQACFHLENCPIHRGYIYRFVQYDYRLVKITPIACAFLTYTLSTRKIAVCAV